MITLAQAQVNTQDDVNFRIIDDLRRYSWLWDQIVFDDVVNPTGGGTLTYGYTRLKTPRTAAFRAYNTEYVPQQAETERLSVDLVPWGGAFNIDRRLAHLGRRQTDQVALQMQQLEVATTQKFQEALINGDTAVDVNGFDGLDVALTGTDTEYDPLDEGVTAGYLDWSMGTINTQALAMAQLDRIDDFLSRITPSKTGGGDLGEPGALPPGKRAILTNTYGATRLEALARWASIYTETKDEVGRAVKSYRDWVIVDLGNGQTGSASIIPTYSADADGAGGGGTITGLTDFYAVTFGMDALHGAAQAGKPLVESWLPDFSTSGAVKTGEMEVGPAAMVLESTKSCGVLRKVKVR